LEAETSPRGTPELWLRAEGRPHGVVLLTHGLNGNPASLDSLGNFLARSGLEVFRPAFTGHRGGDGEAFLSVRAEQWEADARQFHAQASARAGELGVPLHHVAYSMSGLIFQALRSELPFARRVYFAPALAMHYWYEPAMWVARTAPWVQFRSRIPHGYNANTVSGFRSAIALHEFHRRHAGGADRVPTLIWCSLQDELVHGAGLRALAAQNPAWEFREVSIAGCTLPVRYHHLIIDEAAVGPTEWEKITTGTVQFLN
jgi:hypothetical protein